MKAFLYQSFGGVAKLANFPDPASELPMARVIAKELKLFGSHGMQAHRYGAMFEMIESGCLRPDQLIGREISLVEAGETLTAMNAFQAAGVTVITSF